MATLQASIEILAEQEGKILGCVATYVCTMLGAIGTDTTLEISDRVDLGKKVLCAATCKEKGVAQVIEALSELTWAEKGICRKENSTGGTDGCNCGC